jgi:hypothetical protein
MSSTAAALIAFGFLCLLLTVMVIAVTWGTNPGRSGFFNDWRDVLNAFRASRNWIWRAWVCGAAIVQLLRTSAAVVGFSAVSSIALDVPSILKAGGELLDNIDKFLEKHYPPDKRSK